MPAVSDSEARQPSETAERPTDDRQSSSTNSDRSINRDDTNRREPEIDEDDVVAVDVSDIVNEPETGVGPVCDCSPTMPEQEIDRLGALGETVDVPAAVDLRR
ncbi:hypothetical protein [Pontivivens ytuae]|uniref:Uncharacterized protein n=1 Tax=Pontivivens ytuae TaxID=2789856 RepID=A0A7S9LUT4_9RHOB|nr:hypothetical protein [Pontivivens ytuae]QPH55571.1 hypothetical protein I0K15_07510 [Pontivivens ytuae]